MRALGATSMQSARHDTQNLPELLDPEQPGQREVDGAARNYSAESDSQVTRAG